MTERRVNPMREERDDKKREGQCKPTGLCATTRSCRLGKGRTRLRGPGKGTGVPVEGFFLRERGSDLTHTRSNPHHKKRLLLCDRGVSPTGRVLRVSANHHDPFFVSTRPKERTRDYCTGHSGCSVATTACFFSCRTDCTPAFCRVVVCVVCSAVCVP